MGARVRADTPDRSLTVMSSPSHLGVAASVVGQSFSVVIGSNNLIGLAFWLAVIAALGALEALAYWSRWPVPSFGDIVARYLHHPFARTGAIVVWLYADGTCSPIERRLLCSNAMVPNEEPPGSLACCPSTLSRPLS